ncbi:melatonin receptor [Branchiostoma belcheri]|nr:melatonin receptor [Branchiostoma belcheri]
MGHSEYPMLRLRSILLLVTLVFLSTLREAYSVDCNLVNSCSCTMADGSGVIDLSPLASTDGTPRYKGYKATQPPDSYLYDWNPCQPFNDGDCQSVAGCHTNPDTGDNYNLGTQDSASFGSADDGTDITCDVDMHVRSNNVHCDWRRSNSRKHLRVRAPEPVRMPGSYCCLCECRNRTEFIVLVSVYLIAGVLYMSFVKNATGMERIPNIGFWRDLPALVKVSIRTQFDCREYKDLKATQFLDDFVYSWNPCSPFSEGGSCMDVAACQLSPDGQTTYSLGSQDSAAFTGDNTTVKLGYTGPAPDNRQSEIALTCTSGATEFIVLGEDSSVSIYKFELKSPCACPGASSGCGGGGISGGTIFVIILLVVLVVYLVGGVLFMSLVKKASGAERIPNVEFWKDLPVLVKDGAVLVISPCRKQSKYDSI